MSLAVFLVLECPPCFCKSLVAVPSKHKCWHCTAVVLLEPGFSHEHHAVSHTFPGSDAGPQLFAMDHFTGTLSPREEVSSVTSVHSSRFITVTCLQGLVFVCVFCIITQPFPVLGTLFSEKCTCHIAQTLVHHFGVQILELDFAFFSLTSHSKSSSWGQHQAVHLNGNPLTFF